jgi:hypothetical protein
LTNRILELNCLVQGDNLRNAFPVKVDITETVGTLKELIKDKKKHAFQHVDTNTLVLWKVSIPANGPLHDDPTILGLSEGESLQPLEELSEVFSMSLPRKHIHVVVRAPPMGK